MRVLSKTTNLLSFCLLLSLCPSVSLAQSQRRTPPETPPTPKTPASKPSGIRVDVNGKFIGPIYTNDALGFTLSLPEGWQPQDTDVQQQLADAASKKAEEIAENPSAQASVARTATLFIAIKPTDGTFNPSVVGMSEDVALIFSVRTPRQYIEGMRHAFAEKSPLAFDDQITTEQINGYRSA